MAYGLDAVPVCVDDERAVVVGVVLGPEAGLAVVRCAGGERGGVPLVHGGARVARERDVRRADRVVGAVRDPEVGRVEAVPRDVLACALAWRRHRKLDGKRDAPAGGGTGRAAERRHYSPSGVCGGAISMCSLAPMASSVLV